MSGKEVVKCRTNAEDPDFCGALSQAGSGHCRCSTHHKEKIQIHLDIHRHGDSLTRCSPSQSHNYKGSSRGSDADHSKTVYSIGNPDGSWL